MQCSLRLDHSTKKLKRRWAKVDMRNSVLDSISGWLYGGLVRPVSSLWPPPDKSGEIASLDRGFKHFERFFALILGVRVMIGSISPS